MMVNMGIYIEALILYIVLFLSGGGRFGDTADFSIISEFARILFYIIPSLALIWYLLLKSKKIKDWKIKPGKKDLISGIIALPCLLTTGFAIAVTASRIGSPDNPILLNTPSTFLGWAILCFSCMSAAYLEESFFRFYLLSGRDKLKLNAPAALALSVALFSVCHIYEGPWGFLNSVISAVILAFIFLRYQGLHGIAVAHGLYNIAVYAVNSINAG